MVSYSFKRPFFYILLAISLIHFFLNRTRTLTIATRTFSFDIVTDAKASQSKNNEGNDKVEAITIPPKPKYGLLEDYPN